MLAANELIEQTECDFARSRPCGIISAPGSCCCLTSTLSTRPIRVFAQTADGENLRTKYDFENFAAAGAVSFPESDVRNCGGVTNFVRIAKLVEALGLPVTSQGAHYFTVHSLAAAPDASYLEAHRFGLDSFIEHPMELKDGIALAPERPGRGVGFRLEWIGKSAENVMEALTVDQKTFYETNGYLVLENRAPMNVIEAMREEIARFQSVAANMTVSDEKIDLEDSHTLGHPRIRRVKRPVTQSKVFADLMRSDHILAPARDLIGPNIRLQTSKLNMKSAGYGAAIVWRQDGASYPHTNDDVLAIGVIIDDMVEKNGPLMVFPGTHREPVLDHHSDGVFVGGVDLAAAGLDRNDAVTLTGPAGSISIHHGRILHESALNRSNRSKRLCLYAMMAVDALPVMGAMIDLGSLEECDRRIFCGESTREPRVEPVPVRVQSPLPAKADSIYEVRQGHRARSFERA